MAENPTDDMVCTNCGFRGKPVRATAGSFIVEVVLWLCFILPGLIYSVWRLTTRKQVCPKCKQPTMIPADSPRGRTLIDNVRS